MPGSLHYATGGVVTAPMRVFVGWDKREPVAYDVAHFSLARRATIPVEITPIKLDELRERGIYRRGEDPLATTDFTYSRFLTPFLAGYQGWALFCDCDFLWLADVAELMELADPSKALHCVQHDYRPTETTKMDGQIQTVYPRKNWSSLMLFNCNHPSVRTLTPEIVNTETGALPSSPAMGRRRRYRGASGRMELARGLVEAACFGHAESGPFHTWRPVVRAVAERRLRRFVARRACSVERCGSLGSCLSNSRALALFSEHSLEERRPLRNDPFLGTSIGCNAAPPNMLPTQLGTGGISSQAFGPIREQNKSPNSLAGI